MSAVQTTTATMQAHDDLAALLARNLTLGPVSAPMPVGSGLAQEPALAPADPETEQAKITYSVSQHYHHSAHVVRPTGANDQQQQQKPHEPQITSPESVPLSEQQVAEQLLRQNGIDPTMLAPVQLALFRMSAPDRRDYLVQLWRIWPPVRETTEYNLVAVAAAWNSNDVSYNLDRQMEKEIASAQMRQQQQQEQQQQMGTQQEAMSLDGTSVPVAQQQSLPSATQSADGRWLQTGSQSYMEPYMMSGYEELARREYLASASPTRAMDDGSIPRNKEIYSGFGAAGNEPSYNRAMDPVYDNRLAANSRASWPQQPQSAMAMENQYGALMAMRDCEMEL